MPARPDDGLLRVRVQPRASRAAIGTWREDGTLTVRGTAPPVEGRANAAGGALLATALRVPGSAGGGGPRGHGRAKEVRGGGPGPPGSARRVAGEGGGTSA